MNHTEELQFNPEIKIEKEPIDSEGVFLEFEKIAIGEKKENEEVKLAEVRKLAEKGVIYLWEFKFQGEKEEITLTYQKGGKYEGVKNKETGKIDGKCASKGSVIIRECNSSYPEIVANYDGEKWVEV